MLTITVKEIATRMVDILEDHAKRCEVDLHGVTKDNFNCELDERFQDGGVARCEYFSDISWDYCAQFGEFRDDMMGPWHDAHGRALRAALKLLEKRFPPR